MNENNCPHNSEAELFYYNGINESGWKCLRCKEELGYRPDLDKKLIRAKITGMLLDLTEAKIVHVSNGSEGEGITEYVALVCEKEDRYDQYFIALVILQRMTPSHSDYWSNESVRANFPRKTKQVLDVDKLAAIHEHMSD